MKHLVKERPRIKDKLLKQLKNGHSKRRFYVANDISNLMFIPSVTTLGVISGVGELVWGVDVTGFSSTPSSDTSLNSWMLMLCVILFEHFELLHKSNHFVSLSNQCQQMSALNPESNAGEGGRAQYRKWIRKTKQNNNWVPLAKHYGQWACTQSWAVDILYFVHLQLSLSLSLPL